MDLPEFRNEPFTDLSRSENRAGMEAALAKVGAQLGAEYPLLIGGRRVHSDQRLCSMNPSHPRQVVGVHLAADAQLARQSITKAHEYFPAWSARPAEKRAEVLLSTA